MRFVGVSIDEDPEKLDAMVAEKGIGWPQICDGRGTEGEIPQAYHVTATPTLWLIGGDGRIVGRSHGIAELEEDLSELADG